MHGEAREARRYCITTASGVNLTTNSTGEEDDKSIFILYVLFF